MNLIVSIFSWLLVSISRCSVKELKIQNKTSFKNYMLIGLVGITHQSGMILHSSSRSWIPLRILLDLRTKYQVLGEILDFWKNKKSCLCMMALFVFKFGLSQYFQLRYSRFHSNLRRCSFHSCGQLMIMRQKVVRVTVQRNFPGS